MNDFDMRKSMILEKIGPYIRSVHAESDTGLDQNITLTLLDGIDEAVLSICNNQLQRSDITPEMQKYLLGKIYRIMSHILKKNRSYIFECVKDVPISYNSAYEIAVDIGKKHHVSWNSINKYDQFARAIDTLKSSNIISVTDILTGKDKIPMEYIIKLSRMADKDIKYLKILFHDYFYKLAGYIYITNDTLLRRSHVALNENFQIKRQPVHDPDSMINSLSLTIPSWIKSMQTALEKTIIESVSDEACNNLILKLVELKKAISDILKRLEDNYNE